MNKNRGRYRGKIINTGKWIEGFFSQSGDKAYIVKDTGIAVGYMTMKEVAPKTVCETTGLHQAERKYMKTISAGLMTETLS